jgi:hypothetical protein
MRGIVWIAVLGVLGLGFFAGVEAKTISITIGQKAELRGENLVVKISVGNTGDESAKSVAANLRFGDKAVRGKLHDDLAPNGTFDEELTIPTGTLGEGRWPYSIAVDYADANLYPFQALLVTTQVVGNPPPAKLSVPEIKSDGISESGPLHIKFKNLAAAERDVGFRVIVPEGLEAAEPTANIHLKGWAEDTTSVTVVNRTALAGSRYPVFVAVEYDDGGIHQGLVAQGIVEIVAPRNFWEQNQRLLIVGVGALLALWLVLVLRRATGARASA